MAQPAGASATASEVALAGMDHCHAVVQHLYASDPSMQLLACRALCWPAVFPAMYEGVSGLDRRAILQTLAAAHHRHSRGPAAHLKQLAQTARQASLRDAASTALDVLEGRTLVASGAGIPCSCAGCQTCRPIDEVQLCPVCKVAFYCSPACRKAARFGDHAACHLARFFRTNPLERTQAAYTVALMAHGSYWRHRLRALNIVALHLGLPDTDSDYSFDVAEAKMIAGCGLAHACLKLLLDLPPYAASGPLPACDFHEADDPYHVWGLASALPNITYLLRVLFTLQGGQTGAGTMMALPATDVRENRLMLAETDALEALVEVGINQLHTYPRAGWRAVGDVVFMLHQLAMPGGANDGVQGRARDALAAVSGRGLASMVNEEALAATQLQYSIVMQALKFATPTKAFCAMLAAQEDVLHRMMRRVSRTRVLFSYPAQPDNDKDRLQADCVLSLLTLAQRPQGGQYYQRMLDAFFSSLALAHPPQRTAMAAMSKAGMALSVANAVTLAKQLQKLYNEKKQAPGNGVGAATASANGGGGAKAAPDAFNFVEQEREAVQLVAKWLHSQPLYFGGWQDLYAAYRQPVFDAVARLDARLALVPGNSAALCYNGDAAIGVRLNFANGLLRAGGNLAAPRGDLLAAGGLPGAVRCLFLRQCDCSGAAAWMCVLLCYPWAGSLPGLVRCKEDGEMMTADYYGVAGGNAGGGGRAGCMPVLPVTEEARRVVEALTAPCRTINSYAPAQGPGAKAKVAYGSSSGLQRLMELAVEPGQAGQGQGVAGPGSDNAAAGKEAREVAVLALARALASGVPAAAALIAGNAQLVALVDQTLRDAQRRCATSVGVGPAPPGLVKYCIVFLLRAACAVEQALVDTEAGKWRAPPTQDQGRALVRLLRALAGIELPLSLTESALEMELPVDSNAWRSWGASVLGSSGLRETRVALLERRCGAGSGEEGGGGGVSGGGAGGGGEDDEVVVLGEVIKGSSGCSSKEAVGAAPAAASTNGAAAHAAQAGPSSSSAAPAAPAAEPAQGGAAAGPPSGAAGRPGKPKKACWACGAGSSAAPGGKLRKCSGCRSARYCSEDCQKSHWSAHKPECATLRGQAE